MNCYKCQAEDNLSIKYRTKLGEPRYLCKTCRNKDYHLYKNKKPIMTPEERRRIINVIEWSMFAEKINNLIIRKYTRI